MARGRHPDHAGQRHLAHHRARRHLPHRLLAARTTSTSGTPAPRPSTAPPPSSSTGATAPASTPRCSSARTISGTVTGPAGAIEDGYVTVYREVAPGDFEDVGLRLHERDRRLHRLRARRPGTLRRRVRRRRPRHGVLERQGHASRPPTASPSAVGSTATANATAGGGPQALGDRHRARRARPSPASTSPSSGSTTTARAARTGTTTPTRPPSATGAWTADVASGDLPGRASSGTATSPSGGTTPPPPAAAQSVVVTTADVGSINAQLAAAAVLNGRVSGPDGPVSGQRDGLPGERDRPRDGDRPGQRLHRLRRRLRHRHPARGQLQGPVRGLAADPGVPPRQARPRHLPRSSRSRRPRPRPWTPPSRAARRSPARSPASAAPIDTASVYFYQLQSGRQLLVRRLRQHRRRRRLPGATSRPGPTSSTSRRTTTASRSGGTTPPARRAAGDGRARAGPTSPGSTRCSTTAPPSPARSPSRSASPAGTDRVVDPRRDDRRLRRQRLGERPHQRVLGQQPAAGHLPRAVRPRLRLRRRGGAVLQRQGRAPRRRLVADLHPRGGRDPDRGRRGPGRGRSAHRAGPRHRVEPGRRLRRDGLHQRRVTGRARVPPLGRRRHVRRPRPDHRAATCSGWSGGGCGSTHVYYDGAGTVSPSSASAVAVPATRGRPAPPSRRTS